MLAAIEGTLQLHDGCIWLIRQGGPMSLVVWPPGYSVAGANGTVEVLDQDRHVEAAVGDQVRMIGGEWHQATATRDIEHLIGRPVPAPCRAAVYWVGAVTEIVQRPVRFSGGRG